MNRTLVFVYNADSGFIPAIIDGLRKAIKPATYPCDLCALTYGNVRMKKQWKDFIDSLGLPVKIYYKDDFAAEFPNEEAELPAAYINQDNKLDLVISAKQFSKFDQLEDLTVAVGKENEKK